MTPTTVIIAQDHFVALLTCVDFGQDTIHRGGIRSRNVLQEEIKNQLLYLIILGRLFG